MEPQRPETSSKNSIPTTMPDSSEKTELDRSDSRGQKRKRGNDKTFEKRGRPDKGKNMGRGEYLYVEVLIHGLARL
jgi:hypothetical protein